MNLREALKMTMEHEELLCYLCANLTTGTGFSETLADASSNSLQHHITERLLRPSEAGKRLKQLCRCKVGTHLVIHCFIVEEFSRSNFQDGVNPSSTCASKVLAEKLQFYSA